MDPYRYTHRKNSSCQSPHCSGPQAYAWLPWVTGRSWWKTRSFAYTELRKDLPKRLGSKVRISGWNIPSIYLIYKIYDGETTYYHWNPTSPMDPKKNPTWTSIYVCQINLKQPPLTLDLFENTPGCQLCNHRGVRSQKRFFRSGGTLPKGRSLRSPENERMSPKKGPFQ